MGWLEDLKERVALGEDVDREKYYVTSVNLATLDRLNSYSEGGGVGRQTNFSERKTCLSNMWVGIR